MRKGGNKETRSGSGCTYTKPHVTKQVSEKVFFLADKGSKVEISNVLENINIPAHVF